MLVPRRASRWIAISLAWASLAHLGSAQDEVEWQGVWQGAIEADGGIRTVLRLHPGDDGGWAGRIDSPDQGAFGLALADVAASGSQLSFDVPMTQAHFEGEVDDAGALRGTWSQRGGEIPVLLMKNPNPHRFGGTWEGELNVPGTKLRIEFHLGTRSDGTLAGVMVSPDQSPQPVPLGDVAEDGDQVRWTVPAAQARVDFAWRDGQLVGQFHQGPMELPMTLTKAGAPPAQPRPQTPRPPFPYVCEDVTYAHPSAGFTLAGTLTRPEGDGPFPAVLLITGSGPQDRDEMLFGHRPFLLWADVLTRRGIAVLRVDDRGVGGSGGSLGTSTSEDLATDVQAGVDYLQGRPEIDRSRIALMGHSEGGLIAPMVASERDDVAAIVLLAGPGVPGDEILVAQGALIQRANGASEEAIEQNSGVQRAIFEVVKREPDRDTARAAVRQILDRAAEELGLPLGKAEIDAQVAQVMSPWLHYFLRYDPRPALEQVACPVLAINGVLDLQVPAQVNLDAIEAALEQAGNDDVTARALDGLNHLFQVAETGSPDEYETIEETIAPHVLTLVGDWLVERLQPNR